MGEFAQKKTLAFFLSLSPLGVWTLGVPRVSWWCPVVLLLFPPLVLLCGDGGGRKMDALKFKTLCIHSSHASVHEWRCAFHIPIENAEGFLIVHSNKLKRLYGSAKQVLFNKKLDFVAKGIGTTPWAALVHKATNPLRTSNHSAASPRCHVFHTSTQAAKVFSINFKMNTSLTGRF